MVRKALFSLGLWPLLGCGIVGCANGPDLARVVTVNPGEPTLIWMRQSAGNLTLTLRNDSAGLANDVYSNSKDPSTKVVADAELQTLLDVYAEDGLFQHALGGSAGSGSTSSGFDVLTIDQQGRQWHWVRKQRGAQQGDQAFHKARDYFLAIYNGTVAYHDTTERPNFSSENARAKAEALAARERLQQLRRAVK
jgi:hypothetical protein